MESLPVTLIVKAPNQQIEDQTIKCELSWTINKLKQHLSEVYPSKPPKHEQKLIYSGQLLSDSVILKDILRQYEGQETHTLHLVCSTKYATKQPQRTNATTANIPTAATTTAAPQAPTQVPSAMDQRVPNMMPPGAGAMDPNQYAIQLAWMQQAYLQYMTQYMHLAANSYGNSLHVPPQDGANPVQPPEQPAPAPAPQRNPQHPQRDWLDVFYTISRAIVLFSVVYFYSSPLRFISVLLLGFGLYLYQIGFFRNINNNNNNNNNVAQDPVQPEVQVPSRLMLVWTFFTTFFASLIPEIPAPV